MRGDQGQLYTTHPAVQSADPVGVVFSFGEGRATLHLPSGRSISLPQTRRGLPEGASRGRVPHAKAVVADEESVFVTSANLTAAAQDRNIELGLLVRNPTLAATTSIHFRTLIGRDLLRRLPGA